MRAGWAALLCLCAAAAAAQEAPSQPAAETAEATGALLRGLDKVSGEITDIEIAAGGSVQFGRLTIAMSDCRYPAEDPSSNAYAHLTIRQESANPVFDGWMIASSPALNALDDARYDVWLLRCNTPAAVPASE